MDGRHRRLHEWPYGTMNDWLVRLGFAIAGLVAVWILPDPWDGFLGLAAIIAFIWMFVVAARRGPTGPR
jgi:hypothetical protein